MHFPIEFLFLFSGQMIDDCKRIFYYILFQSGSNGDVMECKYFEEFVDCGDAGEYNCNIDWCIGSFQKKIPNFRISSVSDKEQLIEEKREDEKKRRKCTILWMSILDVCV